MEQDIPYLLLKTNAQESLKGAVPFTAPSAYNSSDSWVTMPSEYEIFVHAPQGFCTYFSVIFENRHTSCSLWINNHEIPATRCVGSLFGSVITIPTVASAPCKVELRITNAESARITSAKLLILRL